jgi:membrane protein DedA with SNARE-associated domain
MVTLPTDHLLAATPAVAYATVGTLVFAEAGLFFGFVLPGETAVLLGGVLAARHRLSLAALLLIVVAAAVVGDTVGYEVGKRAGPRVLTSAPLRRQAHRLVSAEEFLHRRGGLAVFLGRFTAFLRAVMPAMAGLSRMPYRTFLIWNAAGGLVWGCTVVLAGFLAGDSYMMVEKQLGQGSAALLAVAVVTAAALWHRRRQTAGRRGTGAAKSVEPPAPSSSRLRHAHATPPALRRPPHAEGAGPTTGAGDPVTRNGSPGQGMRPGIATGRTGSTGHSPMTDPDGRT